MAAHSSTSLTASAFGPSVSMPSVTPLVTSLLSSSSSSSSSSSPYPTFSTAAASISSGLGALIPTSESETETRPRFKAKTGNSRVAVTSPLFEAPPTVAPLDKLDQEFIDAAIQSIYKTNFEKRGRLSLAINNIRGSQEFRTNPVEFLRKQQQQDRKTATTTHETKSEEEEENDEDDKSVWNNAVIILIRALDVKGIATSPAITTHDRIMINGVKSFIINQPAYWDSTDAIQSFCNQLETIMATREFQENPRLYLQEHPCERVTDSKNALTTEYLVHSMLLMTMDPHMRLKAPFDLVTEHTTPISNALAKQLIHIVAKNKTLGEQIDGVSRFLQLFLVPYITDSMTSHERLRKFKALVQEAVVKYTTHVPFSDSPI